MFYTKIEPNKNSYEYIEEAVNIGKAATLFKRGVVLFKHTLSSMKSKDGYWPTDKGMSKSDIDQMIKEFSTSNSITVGSMERSKVDKETAKQFLSSMNSSNKDSSCQYKMISTKDSWIIDLSVK